METFDGQARNLDEGPGLLQSAWRYRWMVAAAALLGALLGYGWEARQPTLYEGVSHLLLSPGVRATGDAPQVREEPERFLSNQQALIGSWPVLQRAVKASPGLSVALLNRRMSTVVSKESDVIAIRVLAPTPTEAKRLADAVGTAYDQFVRQSSRDAARAEIRLLEEEVRELNGTIIQLEAAIRARPGDHGLQARLRAAKAGLDANATRRQALATQAKVGVSHVVLQQNSLTPLRPAQPSPSRGAAAGLLLGLVGSAVLAWWLNSRRVARSEQAEQRRVEQPQALSAVGEGWSARPEPGLEGRTAGWADRPRAAGNGNGAQRNSGAAALGGWLTSERPTDPNDAEGAADAVQQQAEAGFSAGDGRQAATVRMPVQADGDDLRELLARFGATLGDEPIDWYLEKLPQRMAEQLTENVHADVVVLLLDIANGPFEVAGEIGLTATERTVVIDVQDDILQEALRQGASIFQDDNPVPGASNLPGSRDAEAMVLVPLVDGSSWLGMLVVGRHSANSSQVVAFTDQEIERIILYAMEIAPTLQAVLLLHRLQESLRRRLDTSPRP